VSTIALETPDSGDLQASSGPRSAPAWRLLPLEGSGIHGAVEGHAIRHFHPNGTHRPPHSASRLCTPQRR
jgi:hypothetical protein